MLHLLTVTRLLHPTGKNFLEARALVDCKAGASALTVSLSALVALGITARLVV